MDGFKGRFRASCNRRALDLGLRGWVRNLRDGSVEVQAEGLLAFQSCGPGASGAAGDTGAAGSLSQLPVTGDDWFEVRH